MRKMTLSGSLSLAALGVSLLSAGSSQAALVAYYPLDGNFNDVVGGFHGTGVNAPSFAASPLGQAVVLNGSNQYATLTTGSNLQLGGNFTVSAHVNFDVLSGDKTILGNDSPGQTNNTLHLIARNTGIHMGFYANDIGPSGTLTTGNWTHLAWQFDNGTQRTFINGVQVGSGNPKTAFAGVARDVLLGRWHDGNYMDGQIDDVAVYNDVLPANHIAFLANGGNPASLPDAIHWDFRSGDFNDWEIINGPIVYRASDGGGIVADAVGGGFALDNNHVNAVFRSPAFRFTGETTDGINVLSVDWAGGQGDQENNGPSFSNPNAVINFNGGESASNGEKAVAILDLATGEYVGWVFNSGNGNQGFTHLSLTDFNLLGLDLNRTYALDFYENDEGGWGWTQMRQVVIAAEIFTVPEPGTLSLIGLAGLGLLRRRRRIA